MPLTHTKFSAQDMAGELSVPTAKEGEHGHIKRRTRKRNSKKDR